MKALLCSASMLLLAAQAMAGDAPGNSCLIKGGRHADKAPAVLQSLDSPDTAVHRGLYFVKNNGQSNIQSAMACRCSDLGGADVQAVP